MGIAVDKAGGVFVTGTIYSSPYIYYTAQEFATVRYVAATGDQSWDSRYDAGNNFESAADIAVDDSGGVFVTGTSGSEAAGYDYVTIRYEATSGNSSWFNRYKTNNSYDAGVYLAVDNKGGVYITGTSTSEITSSDYFTIRYDALSGKQTWDKKYNSDSNGTDFTTAIAVDATGGVYVTGASASLTSTTYAYATVGYNAVTGEQKWVQRYEGPNGYEASAADIAVDNKGSVFVTGNSEGYLTTFGYESATGEQRWVTRYNFHNSYGRAIAVSSEGGVIVAGTRRDIVNGVNTLSDLITLRYEAISGKEDWVQRYSDIGSLRDYPIAVAVDAEGNSYVTGTSENFATGTSKIVTIKYSPTGDSLWGQVYDEGKWFNVSQAVVVDNQGGIYVTGFIGGEDNRDSFVTIRYDADTGEQSWVQEYDKEHTNWATSIAVDKSGGVYVTGVSGEEDAGYNYVTIRYNADTGQQIWTSLYKANSGVTFGASIAVDRTGGVYITGATGDVNNWDYVTVRYNSATGKQSWASRYDGGGEFEQATAIALDSSNVYVTGVSGSENFGYDYVTISYDAANGQQRWDSRYKANTNFYSAFYLGSSITVDNSGSIYVTGTAGSEDAEDFATLRYDAATGKQIWASRYNKGGNSADFASDIAADSAGVYVTGTSWYGDTLSFFSTVKYAAADGLLLWDAHTAGPLDGAVDMNLDSAGNIIVTGRSSGRYTGLDFLTIKYSQGQCPVLADGAIQGNTTAPVNTKDAVYTLTGSNATSYTWHISGSDGANFTGFSGQGTSSISVDWPAAPDVYKLSVSYGAGKDCPTWDTTLYVHVFDPEAGFVTGGGWLTSPVNPSFELMQAGGKVHWALIAKYKPRTEDVVQGSLMLLLESGPVVFRSTSVEDGSLVITGNQAFFRGQGALSYLHSSGSQTTDPRSFAYLVSATDGNYSTKHIQKTKGKDRLRILIWELNADGTRGAVVYDNQAACSTNLAENAPACAAIGGGNITIHKLNLKASRENAVLALEEAPDASGLVAYPTAFSERTTLAFTTDQDAAYSLEIYDLKGALVRRVATGTAQAGQRYEHEVKAEGLPKGLYLARLAAGDKIQTVKIILER